MCRFDPSPAPHFQNGSKNIIWAQRKKILSVFPSIYPFFPTSLMSKLVNRKNILDRIKLTQTCYSKIFGKNRYWTDVPGIHDRNEFKIEEKFDFIEVLSIPEFFLFSSFPISVILSVLCTYPK